MSAPEVRDDWTPIPVDAADLATHKTVCQRPVPPGLSWRTPCTACPKGCAMYRHEHITHKKIFTPVRSVRTTKCTGRNNYGPCRDCGCTGFRPQIPQETS